MAGDIELEVVNPECTTRRLESEVIPTTPIPIVRNCAEIDPNLDETCAIRTPPFPANLEFTFKSKYNTLSSSSNSSKMDQMKILHKNILYLIKKNIFGIVKIIFMILSTIFVCYACYYDFNKAKPILVIFILSGVYLMIANVLYFFGDSIGRIFQPVIGWFNEFSKYGIWLILLCSVTLFCVFVGVSMKKTKYHGISIAGYITIIGGAALFSKSHKNINPYTIVMALSFQMFISYICCRLNFGVSAIKSMSDFISNVIGHSEYGAKILFREELLQMFIFKIFPPLVFFSALINLLYYIGIMGWVTVKGAWLMRLVLNITSIESVCIFANIFVGGVEASLLIKPYLPIVTKSEMMLILAGGFSSIAGGILAVFLNMGIPGVHLITSCLMSPFGTVALAKLVYPDMKKNKKLSRKDDVPSRIKEENCFHAISEGAAAAIGLIAYIVVNLMAFYSLTYLANSLLNYLSHLVCNRNLTLQIIFSYLFYPLAVLMGVEPTDRFKISELLGIKLFVNELTAFEQLNKYIQLGDITERTQIIGTYALCSFANFANLGFTIGGMTVLAPQRAKQIAKLLPISFCCGFMVSILNGTIAGLMTNF